MGHKSVLLRLDEELAEEVAAVAQVEGRTVSDVMREALAEHVDRRRRDPKFRKMVAAAKKRHSKLLDRLAEDER